MPAQTVENPPITSDSTIIGPFEPRYIDVYEDDGSQESDSNGLAVDDDDDHRHDLPCSTFESWCRAEAIEQEFIDEDDNGNSGTFSGALQNYLATRGEYGCEAVRYSWSGRPIFDGTIPKQLKDNLTCHLCGAPRVFEVQLFPSLNNSLKLNSLVMRNPSGLGTNHFVNLPDMDKLNQDWFLAMTTVLVFSCSVSCSPTEDNWVQECVVVQTDSSETQIITPQI